MPFGFATLGRANDGLAPRKAAPGAAYMAAFNNAFPAGFKKIGMGPAAGRKIPANATVGRVSPAKVRCTLCIRCKGAVLHSIQFATMRIALISCFPLPVVAHHRPFTTHATDLISPCHSHACDASAAAPG